MRGLPGGCARERPAGPVFRRRSDVAQAWTRKEVARMGPMFRTRAARAGAAAVSLFGGGAGATPASAAGARAGHLSLGSEDAFRVALGLPGSASFRFGGASHRHGGRDAAAARIARMIRAGNRIARLPYVWGGGHGSFAASGYDCSGSVSYVLHAGGLLAAPEDSGALESFGVAGKGRHVTIYANGGHAFMVIDGRRFDTIALQETGTRWSRMIGDTSGYVARHPRGL
jgi:cell wall-associated NlpC family hydrolase